MKHNKKYKYIFILLFIAFALYQNQIYASMDTNNFRASVVKVNITPENPQLLQGYDPRESIGVLDSIYHRIVILDDGKTRFLLISSEVCEFSPAYYDRVSSRIRKIFGIHPTNFWWTVTHTHSAPRIAPQFAEISFASMAKRASLTDKYTIDTTYTAFFEQKLIEGITDAQKKLTPASLGVGWGFSQANINRRAIDIDGKSTIGLNPDGAVDRRIGLLRINRADGIPLACIANYPIHGTVMGRENQLISGDVPGVVAQYFENKSGVPLLFINGAAGNLAPIYSVYPNHRAGHLSQFGVLLGDKILKAFHDVLNSTANISLYADEIIVETPMRPDLKFPKILANYVRTTGSETELAKIPIRFLKINKDIAIWAAPVELFCEISNEIRDLSPFAFTFYFGLTNGYFGYLTTKEAYAEEGYEPNVSPFTSNAAGDLTESVVTRLKGKLLAK